MTCVTGGAGAMNQDQEHLKLLSVFHYVVGGISALTALLPIFHLLFGIFILAMPLAMEGQGAPPPAFIGWFMIGIALFVIASGLAMAGVILAAGHALSRRRRRIFCLVVAGVECLMVPYGTVLGVFTFIVLSRDSVRELFLAHER
jgi:hypothetical protein